MDRWTGGPVDWLESLVEGRIREVTERGEFDKLPGAGKPPDLSDADDRDWWIKRFVRRENVDLTTQEQVRAGIG